MYCLIFLLIIIYFVTVIPKNLSYFNKGKSAFVQKPGAQYSTPGYNPNKRSGMKNSSNKRLV